MELEGAKGFQLAVKPKHKGAKASLTMRLHYLGVK
jgi:hypothetical protein